MSRISIIALEGIEETNDETLVSRERILLDIEQNNSELSESSRYINDYADSITDTVQTADAISEVSARMSDTIADGGMDEGSARVVQAAVEALVMRLGIPAKRASFAMEGFKDKTTRVAATTVAVEGLREIGKKIWDAIVKAIEKLITLIKDFYKKITGSTEKLSENADNLEKKVNSAQEAAKKEEPKEEKKTVTIPQPIALLLQDDGKVASAEKIINALNISKNANISEVFSEIFVNVEEIVRNVKDKEKFDGLIEKYFFNGQDDEVAIGNTKFEGIFNLANRALYMEYLSTKRKDFYDGLDYSGLFLFYDNGNNTKEIENNIEKFNFSDIKEISKLIKENINRLENNGDFSNKIEDTLSKIKSLANVAAHDKGSEESQEYDQRITVCSKLINGTLVKTIKTSNDVLYIHLKVITAIQTCIATML